MELTVLLSFFNGFFKKKKKKKILKTWRSNMIKSMAQIEQLLKPNSTVLSAQNK